MNTRTISFYSENEEGINGTDYYVEITRYGNNVTVRESHCGRTRGSIWSEAIEYETDHFWLTVQNLIRNYGGMENISENRIGQVEHW